MNFYKHHIGDYDTATSHLSLIEDAIYSRLLRFYYRDEKALPVEVSEVSRKIRARDEAETVKAVLIEFFHLADDGWHHKRCDEEIAAASAIADTNRRIAVEREARKRGTRGARSVLDTSDEAGTRPNGEREPSQTPDSKTPDSPSDGSSTHLPAAPVVGVFEGHEQVRAYPNPAAAYTVPLTALGVQVTSLNPELLAAIEEGVTVDHLVEVAKLNPGKPIKYLTSQARRERAEKASAITPGAPRGNPQKLSEIERARAAYDDITGTGDTLDEHRDPRLVG